MRGARRVAAGQPGPASGIQQAVGIAVQAGADLAAAVNAVGTGGLGDGMKDHGSLGTDKITFGPGGAKIG